MLLGLLRVRFAILPSFVWQRCVLYIAHSLSLAISCLAAIWIELSRDLLLGACSLYFIGRLSTRFFLRLAARFACYLFVLP